MASKIYDVRWEDDDGEQGYYVRLSDGEATTLKSFLKRHARDGVIKDPRVDAIEGDIFHTAKGFRELFSDRYFGE